MGKSEIQDHLLAREEVAAVTAVEVAEADKGHEEVKAIQLVPVAKVTEAVNRSKGAKEVKAVDTGE